MDPHSRAAKKNTCHANEVLPYDNMDLIQRPHYQWGSLCQDPAGNWTTWRPDHRKEMQTAVVWTCVPFIRSGQNRLAWHSEWGKKTRQTRKQKKKILINRTIYNFLVSILLKGSLHFVWKNFPFTESVDLKGIRQKKRLLLRGRWCSVVTLTVSSVQLTLICQHSPLLLELLP